MRIDYRCSCSSWGHRVYSLCCRGLWSMWEGIGSRSPCCCRAGNSRFGTFGTDYSGQVGSRIYIQYSTTHSYTQCISLNRADTDYFHPNKTLPYNSDRQRPQNPQEHKPHSPAQQKNSTRITHPLRRNQHYRKRSCSPNRNIPDKSSNKPNIA